MSETRDSVMDAAERAFGKPKLYCSFCGKSQHETWKLIAGPTVFICDECTGLCASIIMEDPMTAAQHLVSLEHVRLGELKLAAQDALEEALGAQGASSEMTIGQLLAALGQVIYSAGIEQQLIDAKHPPPVSKK